MKWKINNPKVAILLMGLYAFSTGCLSTYYVAMISTMEKRFEWPTSQMGWLLSADDVGYLITVMPVAYYGGKGRHSQVLSMSAVLLFVASFLRICPFLIFGPKFTPEQIVATDANSAQIGANITDTSAETLLNNFPQQQLWGYVIQLAGGVLHGVANTPFWNVGAALIDDFAGGNSGPFLGFLFVIRTLSPIVGFLIGGQLTTINEGLVLQVGDFALGMKDPRWIGAWWLGILIFGGIILLNSPLLALLDSEKLREVGKQDRAKKRMKIYEQQQQQNSKAKPSAGEDEDSSDSSSSIAATAANPAVLAPSIEFLGSVPSLTGTADFGSQTNIDLKKLSFIELLKFLKTLYTNPVFLTLYIGTMFEFSAFIIFVGFFPKYIEAHFYKNSQQASLMSSVSLAGASALAIIISSIISKIRPMALTHMNLYHAVVNIVAACAFPVLFAFSCDKIQMIGPHNFHVQSENFTSCIDGNSCPKFNYDPICIDNISFMSPCYAGCNSIHVNNITMYYDCLCSNITATPGVCTPECSNIYLYLTIFFIIRVVGSMASVQFVQMVMKLPNSRELKALAIGSFSFIFGLLGTFSAPIAGKLIDTVCIVQNPSQSGHSFCLFYDTDKFRYLLHSIGALFQIPSCLLYTVSYLYSRKRYPVEKDEVTLQKRQKLQLEADAEEMQRLPGASVS